MKKNGYYLSLSDDDIISCIHTICDSFISLSEQKDVSLTFYSAVSSLNMLFDGDKMREVMMSLLSNAFKFTCSGGRVDVFVSLVEGQDSREMHLQQRKQQQPFLTAQLEWAICQRLLQPVFPV